MCLMLCKFYVSGFVGLVLDSLSEFVILYLYDFRNIYIEN